MGKNLQAEEFISFSWRILPLGVVWGV